MVAVLMLVYHVILCKANSEKIAGPNRVLITLCKVLWRPALSQSRVKVGRTVLQLKKTDESNCNLIEKGLKFTVSAFLNPNISLSANHGGWHFEDF